MIKRIALAFVTSAALSSCHTYDHIKEYPLTIVGKENYEEVKFRYEKLKTFEYEYCQQNNYLLLSATHPMDRGLRALAEFKKHYSLKENEYVTIKDRRASLNCYVVELDLIRKLED